MGPLPSLPHSSRAELLLANQNHPCMVGSQSAVKAASLLDRGRAPAEAPAARDLRQVAPPLSPSVSLSAGWESWAARSGRDCPGYPSPCHPPQEASRWRLEGRRGSEFPVGGSLAPCLCSAAPGSHLPLCPASVYFRSPARLRSFARYVGVCGCSHCEVHLT